MKLAGLLILMAVAPVWAAGVGSTSPCWIAVGQEGPSDDIIVDTSGAQPEVYVSYQGLARAVDPAVTALGVGQLKRVRDVCFQGAGTGSGSLKIRIPQGTSRPLGRWVLGDFNGDGRKDSASVNGNVLTVQMGAAGTTFGSPSTVTLGAGHVYSAAGAGDFNGDGKLDLVVCCTSVGPNARALVMLGNGNGTFQAPVETVSALSIALTDWNKDGKQDLIAATPTGTLTVAQGQGNGTFQVAQTTQLVSAVTIAVADATGDGRDDVIALDTARVLVYPGQADGSFANSYTADLFWNQGLTFSAGDFTGDGKLDLAVTHQYGMTEILRGNPPTGFVRTGMVSNQQLRRGIAVDLDDNGTAELLLPGAGSSGLQLVAMTAAGAPAGAAAYGIAPSGNLFPDYDPLRSSAVAADFDKDGRVDIALIAPVTTNGVLQVFSSSGPTAPLNFPSFSGGRLAITQMQAADLNGDGRLDIVALDAESSSLVMFRNLGQNRFAPAVTISLQAAARCVLVADFNNDSQPDLAIGLGSAVANSGRIEIRYNNGGDFSQPQTINTGMIPFRLATADFNGDFKTDLVYIPVSASGGTPAGLVLNQTNNVFLQPQLLPLPPYASLGDTGVAGAIQTADVNGDGSYDVLIAAPFTDGGMAVLQGDGRAGFRVLAVDKTVGPKAVDLVPVDVDQDGKLDLLVAHCCGDMGTRLYYGKADGTFGAAHAKPAGSHADRVWLADVDGDQRLDLVARTYSGVSVSPFYAEKQLGISSAASGRGPTVAIDSIVSAYGTALTFEPLGATAINQTEIGGVRVFLTDAQGTTTGAPLFYVSGGQVNFLVPAGLTPGPARVTLQTPTNTVWFADIVLARVEPGLFIVDISRLVAANVIRVRANGQQVVESPYSLDGGVLHGAPVDVGPVGDKVILVLYGTGVRGRNGLGDVTATVGGAAAVVEYVGAQNEFPGLDQVNIVLPRSAAGKGSVEIVVTVEGKASNSARLLVQ